MNLSVGLVGLPNVGKSTLFNALASRRLAETAPRPFTTIDPHEAVVPVPDENLEQLWDLVRGDPSTALRMTVPEKIPATVTFIDIAGLVKDAHQGEGLGNQFLAKIREVDAIIHVVRAFIDPSLSHPHPSHEPGSIGQILEDIEIVNLELELGGISQKPSIYVLNVEESGINNFELIAAVEGKTHQKALTISAKLEEELIDFSEKERSDYLKSAGQEKTGLARLILFAYELLGFITFYTIKGGQEVHAWSIKKGASAIDAAGAVHTDFAQNFIKAEAIAVADLFEAGGWSQAKEKGKVRLEGKDYIVADKDVIEFKVGS